MKTFRDILISLDAPKPMIDWVGDRNIEQFWDDCGRPEWLMWYLVASESINRRYALIIVCKLLRTREPLYMMENVWHNMIDTAQDYAYGLVTRDELISTTPANTPSLLANIIDKNAKSAANSAAYVLYPSDPIQAMRWCDEIERRCR